MQNHHLCCFPYVPVLTFTHIFSFFADCHVVIFNMGDSDSASAFSVMVDIDTEHEPVAFCVLSPDAKVLLSANDDGELESWSTDNSG